MNGNAQQYAKRPTAILMISPSTKQATEAQSHKSQSKPVSPCPRLRGLSTRFLSLPGQPDRQLAFLARLRAQDLTKRIRQRVRLAGHADAAAIDRAEQVEHLADQLDAAAAKLHRFAHTHVKPLVFVALDLRLRNRRQTAARRNVLMRPRNSAMSMRLPSPFLVPVT